MPSLPRSHSIVGRWVPSAGATGFRLVDRVRSNHGALTNMDSASDWVVSGGKGALDFDGVNDRVAVNTLSLSTLDFAISFWAQQRGAGAIGMPIGNSGMTNSYVWFRSGNYLRFQIPTGNVEFSLTTFTALRHYCLFSTPSTAALSTINLFVDGVSIGALSLAAGTFSINSIGDGYSGNSFPFPGVIDDVTIWNAGLTANEAREIYRLGRGYGVFPEPDFDEGFGGGFKAYWARRQSQLIGGGV
jgi:hypothetical protein